MSAPGEAQDLESSAYDLVRPGAALGAPRPQTPRVAYRSPHAESACMSDGQSACPRSAWSTA